MKIRNLNKKEEIEKSKTMEHSKTWTFYLDNDDAIEKGFMEKILKSMLKERREKGNKVDPEIIIKVRNKKEGEK